MNPARRSPEGRHQRRTRILDLAILGFTAPIWVPAMLTIGLAVLATSGRPVLFRQTRQGRDDAPFEMLKFRSMVNGPNPLVPDPSRITPLGRALRRTSLDELPQLLNVVRGEMSLVGPRPMLPQQARELTAISRGRHDVRPGLTGLAQVRGRNALLWEERIDHDLEWAQNPTVAVYLRTIRRTGRVIVAGDGVDGHDPADRFVDLAAIDLTSAERQPADRRTTSEAA